MEVKRLSAINGIIAIGFAWGAIEAALTFGLKGVCGRELTGSIMTGLAMVFLAGTHTLASTRGLLLLPFALATGLKLLAVAALGLPLASPAAINPIAAYGLETAAVMAIVSIPGIMRPASGVRALLPGGLAAALAALTFPAVGFITAVPACTIAGSGLPTSIAWLPIATVIGAIAFRVGRTFSPRILAPSADGWVSAARPLAIQTVMLIIFCLVTLLQS